MDRPDGAGLPREARGWAAGNRVRVEHPLPNDPQPAGTLGDQQVAVGQECQAVRILQPLREDRDPDVLLLGRVIQERSLPQRLIGKTGWRDRHSEGERHFLLCPGDGTGAGQQQNGEHAVRRCHG